MEDHHSLSNVTEIAVSHYDLSLAVDFEQKKLTGSVTLHATIVASTTCFSLDTNHLVLKEVTLNDQPVEWSMQPAHAIFGTRLDIALPLAQQRVETQLLVTITYETTSAGDALQWLSPAQTADKMYPYMFTQCQAIHARSMLPCQDTPCIKATYAATMTSPDWSTCLMSAVAKEMTLELNDKEAVVLGTTTCYWTQKVPIPSYLIAMVVGKLESREIGPRSRVWAEASVVEAAAADFHQTEAFLRAAETITAQPYVWGRYDLVCLPPSFPYGGMENPCLTFVTPTLLTGDAALADVIAHEIAHSWTGNLITNATWEHFWLNEGWTMWLQRQIMVSIKNDASFYEFDATIGYRALEKSVALYGQDHVFTQLVPPLKGMDPDDAFSRVPYEKGFNFLHYLSTIVGATAFQTFAQAYIAAFKYHTVTTSQFLDFFKAHFATSGMALAVNAIAFDTWVYSPGLPLIPPTFDQSMTSQCTTVAEVWLTNPSDSDLASVSVRQPTWESRHYVVMLEHLASRVHNDPSVTLTQKTLERMAITYGLHTTRNAEITFCWQVVCLHSQALDYISTAVVTFLKAQGRMKFVRPLFRLLNESGGRALALATFASEKKNYHPIAQKMIAKDLE